MAAGIRNVGVPKLVLVVTSSVGNSRVRFHGFASTAYGFGFMFRVGQNG